MNSNNMKSVINELKNFNINQMRLNNLKKNNDIHIYNVDTQTMNINTFELESGKFTIVDKNDNRYIEDNPSGEYQIYWSFLGENYNDYYIKRCSGSVPTPKNGIYLLQSY